MAVVRFAASVPEERPEAGFDHKLPDLFGGRLDVVLGVFEQVVEEFAAGDLVGGDGVASLAPSLLPQELIPKPYRVLPLRGSR